MKNKPLLILLILLLLLFLFTYGAASYPWLHADHAIHIIMIDHLSFSKDLYYMGQDRIGSVVPALGWVFYQFGISSIWSVSLVQVLIFGITGLVMLSLFKKKWLGLLAIIALLFPSAAFQEQVMPGQPYAGHLLILSVTIFLFRKVGLKIPLFLLLAGVGLWASDLFAANIATAFVLYFFSGQLKFREKSWWLWLAGAIVLSIPGFWLRHYAKLTSTTTDPNYTQSFLATPMEFLSNTEKLILLLWEYLSFEAGDFLASVGTWLFGLMALLILLQSIQKPKPSWASFFLLSGIFTIGAILVSEWAFRMGLPIRYFSIGVLQILWGILLATDERLEFGAKRTAIASLMIVAFAFSGLLEEGKFVGHKPGKLYASTVKEVANRIKTEGLLGSYWHVYLVEAFHPTELTSVVIEPGINRDYDAMKRFTELDTITVIRDISQGELEPELYDHGVYYIKAGKTQVVDNLQFGKYYRSQNFKSFYNPYELSINSAMPLVGDSTVIFNPHSFDQNSYMLGGPYLTLPAGTYQVCFTVETDSLPDPAIYLYAHSRRGLLDQSYLHTVIDNPCFEVKLKEAEIDFQFGMTYYGKGEIKFRGVRLEKIK